MDVILEKGKSPIIRKLRTIQLIEVDIQLVFRILITLRNSIRAKHLPRLSTFNYGNRKNYDIEKAILEKQIIKEIDNMTHLPFM